MLCLAAFFKDLISVSKAPTFKSNSNLSPFSSPINWSSITTFLLSIIFILNSESCFKPLAKILALLSIKLLVSSSWSLSESLSSNDFVLSTQ